MPKKLFKKWMPSPEKIQSNKSLHFLGDVLHDPNLWHINRRSVSRAFLNGLFFAFIPMPAQMAFAAFASIWLRSNLPLSVALVWISNPLTMPPLFYANYVIGAWLLGVEPQPFAFQPTFDWFLGKLGSIGAPLYLGSFVVAIAASVGGFFAVDLLWRRTIAQSWKERRLRRRASQAEREVSKL